MKLNPDCIRDILLSVEETCTFDENTIYDRDSLSLDRLKKYSHEEIIYHINQCNMSGFLNDVAILYEGNFASIGDLSPQGHEFLANIRNDTFFENVKNIAKELGLNSLKDVSNIALNCAAMLIKVHFNLP